MVLGQEHLMKPVPKTPILVRVINRYSPIHGDDRGRYLQAAIRNEAGRAFGRVVMSWDRPYKVAPDALVVTAEDIARVLEELSKRFVVGVYDPHG
jgi:hypothetical protein